MQSLAMVWLSAWINKPAASIFLLNYCWLLIHLAVVHFFNSKTTELKDSNEARGSAFFKVGRCKCRKRPVAYSGSRKSDWQLSVLFAELLCEWWWGLSDKAGWGERRRANTVLSSEEIQFRSINIDMSLSPTKFALGPLVRPIRDGLIYAPLRLWYLGAKQQMASPLAPWILPPWTSLSFSPCLLPLPSSCLPFMAAAFVAVVTGRARRCPHSRITKAPSHHLSNYTLPSSTHRPPQRLFALVLTEKLEDRRPEKRVLISI